MFGSAEQDSEEYQLYEQAGGTFKELQERFNKMLYDASNVSKKSGVKTEYQSGEVINEDGDLKFSMPNENDDLLDNIELSNYNVIKLSKSEFLKLQHEAMTWHGGSKNELISQTLANGTTYLYYFDSDGLIKVIDKWKATNIHEKGSVYDGYKQNRESTDKVISELGRNERTDNSNMFRVDNRTNERTNDTTVGRTIREEQNGNIGRNEQNGFDDQGKSKSHFKNSKAGVDDTSAFSNGEKELRFSIPSKSKVDNEYLSAVEKGDNEAAQKLVDEAAVKWGAYSEDGKSPKTFYHGTGSFGFTEFDLNRMDDKRSIFLTSSPEIASTYAGTEKVKKISDSYKFDISKASKKELADLLNEHKSDFHESWENSEFRYFDKNEVLIFNNETTEIIKSFYDKLLNLEMPEQDYDNYSNEVIYGYSEQLKKLIKNNDIQGLARFLSNKILEYVGYDTVKYYEDNGVITKKELANLKDRIYTGNFLSSLKFKYGKIIDISNAEIISRNRAIQLLTKQLGIYSLYAKMSNPLVIECNYRNWNNIKYKADISDYYQVVSGAHGFRIYNTLTNKTLYIAENESGEFDTRQEAEKAVSSLDDKYRYAKLNTTREISKYANEQGYDGVEFKKLYDNGGQNDRVRNRAADIYIVFDSNSVKSADTVTYDDNGNVIPLSERFDEQQKDIRYSISSDDKIAKQESKNLEKENETLKNRLHESEIEKDRLRRETQLTEFTTKDDPSVNSFAKSLRRKYGSTMTTDELHQRLNDIYYHLAKRGGVASNVISDKCLKLAEDIANTATEKRQGEFWNELREYFKDKRITLAVQDRNDMGDWQSFRKKYQQSFGLRNEGGLPVDVVYMELHEQFPGLFDDTVTHPADQLREIGEVYEKLISIKMYIKRKRPVTNRSSSRAFPIHSDTQKTE